MSTPIETFFANTERHVAEVAAAVVSGEPQSLGIASASLRQATLTLSDAVQRLSAAQQRDEEAGRQAHTRLERLTQRERQVLGLIVAGRLNKQIADDLGISIKTVEAHRANIMDKLAARTMADLMKTALLAGSSPRSRSDDLADPSH